MDDTHIHINLPDEQTGTHLAYSAPFYLNKVHLKKSFLDFLKANFAPFRYLHPSRSLFRLLLAISQSINTNLRGNYNFTNKTDLKKSAKLKYASFN